MMGHFVNVLTHCTCWVVFYLSIITQGLELLIEINFKIANTLGRAEEKLGSARFNAIVESGAHDAASSAAAAAVTSKQSNALASASSQLPSSSSSLGGVTQLTMTGRIDADLYALRRGCDRADTLTHVERLVALVSLGRQGEDQLVAVKHMLGMLFVNSYLYCKF